MRYPTQQRNQILKNMEADINTLRLRLFKNNIWNIPLDKKGNVTLNDQCEVLQLEKFPSRFINIKRADIENYVLYLKLL